MQRSKAVSPKLIIMESKTMKQAVHMVSAILTPIFKVNNNQELSKEE